MSVELLPVSVVIPVRDRPHLLRRAVQSVLQQSRPPLQLIVVDDGSRPALSRSDLAAVDQTDVDLQVIRTRGIGGAGARNVGIQASRQPFIALLDSDDWWHEEKLARQFPVLMSCEDPRRSLVYSRHWMVTDEGHQPARFPSREGCVRNALLAGWCPSITSSVIAPRSALLRHPFREELVALQDFELWLRLSPELEFVLVDDYVVYVDRRGSRQSVTTDVARRRAAAAQVARIWKGRLPDIEYRKLIHVLARLRTRERLAYAARSEPVFRRLAAGVDVVAVDPLLPSSWRSAALGVLPYELRDHLRGIWTSAVGGHPS